MIDTEHLRLRRCRVHDVDAVLAYRGRADVARFLTSGVWSRATATREVTAYAAAPFARPGDELVLLAQLRDSGQIAGEVGLVWSRLDPDTAEVGYVFHPDLGRRGLATEAVGALVDAAFEHFGFRHVTAVTDEDNAASRALAERIGMRLLSTATSTDGRQVPECTYVVDRGR